MDSCDKCQIYITQGAATGLICVGAWVYKEYHHYDLIAQSLYILVPATILMAVGVFFFLLGIIGCIGAYKEQKCLLGLVSIFRVVFCNCLE